MALLKKPDPASDSITIRRAEVDDIQAMWEIDRECFEPGVAYSIDIFYYYLLIDREPAFAALDGGKLAGFVLTSKTEQTAGQIITIDILPKWRRAGIGSKLMAVSEEALVQRGATVINLQVAADNGAAIEFYKKLGYRKENFIKNYYGNGKDAYLFIKKT
ncbi:MAG: ribosomal-protein-alanine N-acetyltransferase RimI [bacterium]|nr:MAG: ribosomal-protein-alanine N-acetyltransferase RimI [bacterium]